jgi:hypothetical protein
LIATDAKDRLIATSKYFLESSAILHSLNAGTACITYHTDFLALAEMTRLNGGNRTNLNIAFGGWNTGWAANFGLS